MLDFIFIYSYLLEQRGNSLHGPDEPFVVPECGGLSAVVPDSVATALDAINDVTKQKRTTVNLLNTFFITHFL
ncbi:hypothetical protein [Alteromonas aquimaris]|uniref:hypothetical protein n=1 Tax=Alteromonas aquimaris TaxID=2998417 RepID=UPI002243B3BC|nr:hypothetical protein [Alteromonas aquimaris]